MRHQLDLAPVARLDFVAQGSSGPGWYVHYVDNGRPASERLAIEIGADAFGAIESAAELLGCGVEQIEFGGPVWPRPLDGMVDADQTLEFVPDLLPALNDDREGEWRLQIRPVQEERPEARRYARRAVEGVLLYSPVYGRVMNWSEAGMGIEIARPMRLETRNLFVAKGRKSRIELFGEVRWCRQFGGLGLDESSVYRAGITLIG